MPVKYDLPFTQTSHLIALGSTTLLVGVAIFPFGAGWSGSGGNQGAWPIIVRVVHLGSFSGWFGTQLWVTFFAGLTMYKHLPRHTFGFIQSKLFPKYFLFGAVLSSLSIATYLIENPIHSWGLHESVQAAALGLNLLTVLANVLYVNKATVDVMFAKHKFEKEVSAGQTPGKIEDDKLKILNKNKEYFNLSKRFVRLHTFSTIANLLALCGQGVHLIYIAKALSDI